MAQDVQRLLEHLDNDVARVETLLAEMLARRDHWLRHIHGKDRDELEAALKNARRGALKRLFADYYPARARANWSSLCAYAASNLADGGGSLVRCDTRTCKLGTLPGDEEQDVAWLGMPLPNCRSQKKAPGASSIQSEMGFPPGGTKAGKANRKVMEGRSAGIGFACWLNRWRTRSPVRYMIFVHLPPPAYTEQQWEVLGSITRLLPRAVGQLKLVFQSHNKVDFTEVAQGALRALGEPEMPTDLALALDYRIRHLLIDEFQDTSISQYELDHETYRRMGAGRWPQLCWLVGDPMQSIYRFREAEVGLFLRARAAGIGNVALQPDFPFRQFSIAARHRGLGQRHLCAGNAGTGEHHHLARFLYAIRCDAQLAGRHRGQRTSVFQ